MSKDYYLYFDESGNLGKSGRNFVIACVLTTDPKSLHNKMKKTLLFIKKEYPNLKFNASELKANCANRDARVTILSEISKKDVDISYIIADKKHIYEYLFEDKNILYNYLLKILLNNYTALFKKASEEGSTVNLILDNRTIKVTSRNSFADFIKEHFIYEKGINVNIKVEYRDSKSKNAYNIQAADYIAHSLYSFYEYNNATYYNCINAKVQYKELFPKNKFGKSLAEPLVAVTSEK